MPTSDLTLNLRLLAGYAPSITHICAEAGVNRTQFHRYLADEGLPSLRSLRRICDYFGVEEFEIMLDHSRFREIVRLRPPKLGVVADPFDETLRRLTQAEEKSSVAMGYYHMIFKPDPESDLYYRSIIRLRQAGGGIILKQIERFPRPALALPRRMTYEGVAYAHHGKLFVQVQETRHRRSAWMTVLSVGDFAAPRVLHGTSVGCEPEGTAGILSLPVVWIYLGDGIPLRQPLADCGYFRADEINLAPELDQALSQRG